MKRIGLTGGIGSGKTTVANIFKSLGVPIYFSDERAKRLMDLDQDLITGIKSEFGEAIYVDNSLDRKSLADIVFSDKEKLKKLNALVHPAVGRDFVAWCEAWSSESDYILKEAAILFETGGHRDLDSVIVVSCPEDIRIERVMQRDGVTEEQVRERMNNQWSEEDKVKLADYLILNDGQHSLINRVMELHALFTGPIPTSFDS